MQQEQQHCKLLTTLGAEQICNHVDPFETFSISFLSISFCSSRFRANVLFFQTEFAMTGLAKGCDTLPLIRRFILGVTNDSCAHSLSSRPDETEGRGLRHQYLTHKISIFWSSRRHRRSPPLPVAVAVTRAVAVAVAVILSLWG